MAFPIVQIAINQFKQLSNSQSCYSQSTSTKSSLFSNQCITSFRAFDSYIDSALAGPFAQQQRLPFFIDSAYSVLAPVFDITPPSSSARFVAKPDDESPDGQTP